MLLIELGDVLLAIAAAVIVLVCSTSLPRRKQIGTFVVTGYCAALAVGRTDWFMVGEC